MTATTPAWQEFADRFGEDARLVASAYQGSLAAALAATDDEVAATVAAWQPPPQVRGGMPASPGVLDLRRERLAVIRSL